MPTALVAGMFALPGAAATAQDLTAISVQQRPRPEFDPAPLRLGGFEVLPSAELRFAYDDNVYAARNGKVADALTTLAAAVVARTAWSRHAVTLDAATALTRGLSQTTENTETYDAGAAARIDIGLGTKAMLRARTARAYEPRGSIGDTAARGPRIAYTTRALDASLEHTAGHLVLEAEAALEEFDYAAAPERDYRTWSAALHAGYAVAPGIALFVEGRYNQADYPDDAGTLDRSSQGYALRGGVQFGLTRLIRGRAALGYQDQRYADPAFPRIRGVDFGAALEWSPTPLTTLSLEARRTIQRSPLVGVAGIRQSRYALRIDHELRRNLLLSGRLDQTLSAYAGTARRQTDRAGTLGFEWLLARRVRIAVQAVFQRTHGDTPEARRFDRRRIAVAVRYML